MMAEESGKSKVESSLSWTAILKSLADENRLQIIHHLLKKDASVQDMADTLGMKMYNISKHLKILESSGLVQKKKDGNRRIYNVSDHLKSRLSSDNEVLDLGCCKFIFSESDGCK